MSTVHNTNPYPWPYNGVLDTSRLALVVTGAQSSLTARCLDAQPALVALRTLRATLTELKVPTFVTVHHRPAGRTAPPGRQLLDVSPELLNAFSDSEYIIAAAGFDAFTGSSLENHLYANGFTHLLLAGFASELTVDSTLRSANDRGFECLVLTDALAPTDHQTAARVLHSVTMSGGIFGALGTTSDVLAALIDSPVRAQSAILIESVRSSSATTSPNISPSKDTK